VFPKSIVLLFLAAATFLHAAEPPLAAQSLSMDWVLAEVERSNPDIRAAKAELAMAEGEALAAYAWMPPMLSVELMGMAWPNPDSSQWMRRRIELSQSLPFPGRTLIKGRVASRQALRVRSMARMALEEKAMEARRAYFQLARAERMLKAVEKAKEALGSAAKLSSSRGGFGQLDRMGQVMDTMLAMQMVDLESMLPMWRQERRMAEGRLNVLMGADPARSLPSATLEMEELLALPRAGEKELWEAALRHNPALEEAAQQLEHARLARTLATSAWLPDLMLEGAREEDAMGAQESTLKLGLTLPFLWFWDRAGMAKAASAELERSRQALASRRLQLKEELRQARGEFLSGMEELELVWEKMLPLAEKGLKQAGTGFRSGSVGANEALMAIRGYLDTEQRLSSLIAQLGASQAMLQMLTAVRTQNLSFEMSHD
jgi:outer membrane protein TolC